LSSAFSLATINNKPPALRVYSLGWLRPTIIRNESPEEYLRFGSVLQPRPFGCYIWSYKRVIQWSPNTVTRYERKKYLCFSPYCSFYFSD
jgi:hypothetical protein